MHAVSLNDLCGKIRQWGIAKGITGPEGKSSLLGQLEKTEEELNETMDAALEYEDALLLNDGEQMAASLEEVKDGIGDTVVTLVLAAELAGLTIEDCVEHAYNQIKDRTGKMVAGKFVKD